MTTSVRLALIFGVSFLLCVLVDSKTIESNSVRGFAVRICVSNDAS